MLPRALPAPGLFCRTGLQARLGDGRLRGTGLETRSTSIFRKATRVKGLSAERGTLACSATMVREICGHLRERSGFAAIRVEVFALDLKDHEWARMITNFPGQCSLFIREN